MCKHDPIFRVENEQFGGWGCPICQAERRKKLRSVMPPAGKCPVCGCDLAGEIDPTTTCPECARRWWNGIEEIKF